MKLNPETLEMLYWLQDKSWYTFDAYQDVEYHLTDAAPERARKAYEKWLKLQKDDE